MMQELARQVETLMTNLIEDIDRKFIRKMQSDMYKCASNCCEDQTKTIQGVQRCVRECTAPVENAQQFIQGEFERSKKRLDRCFEDCSDKLQDKVGPNATEEKVKRYRGEYEGCAVKCMKNYCDSWPQLEKSISDAVASKFL